MINLLKKNISHDVEAFGPVSTLMPYKDAEEAAALAKEERKFSRLIVPYDDKFVGNLMEDGFSAWPVSMFSTETMQKESTGHGSPLPTH